MHINAHCQAEKQSIKRVVTYDWGQKQTCARLRGEPDLQFRMVSKTEVLRPPLEDELGKMRTGLWREVGFAKNEDSGPERRIFAWTIGPKRRRFAVLCRIVTGGAETPYACDSPALV